MMSPDGTPSDTPAPQGSDVTPGDVAVLLAVLHTYTAGDSDPEERRMRRGRRLRILARKLDRLVRAPILSPAADGEAVLRTTVARTMRVEAVEDGSVRVNGEPASVVVRMRSGITDTESVVVELPASRAPRHGATYALTLMLSEDPRGQ